MKVEEIVRQLLAYRAVPISTPGTKKAEALLRKRGYRFTYFTRLNNEGQFEYLVRIKLRRKVQ